MHLDLGYEELYRVDTGSDRRHGYQFSDRQFDALARMNTLGLRDSKKIFTLADSKNIGYDAFCEKYGQYTSGWHSVREQAVTPQDRIRVAVDFESFENHTSWKGFIIWQRMYTISSRSYIKRPPHTMWLKKSF